MGARAKVKTLSSYAAKNAALAETAAGEGGDPFEDRRASRVSDREGDYHKQRLQRDISPERSDPFLDKAPSLGVPTCTTHT